MRLEVQALETGYGKAQVLFGVDLEVEAGELVALLGANGAGKTTLLRALSGLLRPWKGSVLLGGKDLRGLSPARRARLGLGHVPEGRQLFPLMTVEENLRLGAAFLAPGGKAWRRGTLTDPESNVFHKLLEYCPASGDCGLLSVGGSAAALKLWRPGAQPQVLWKTDFGGRFSRLPSASSEPRIRFRSSTSSPIPRRPSAWRWRIRGS